MTQESEDKTARQLPIERHIQTILTALTVMLLGWVGLSLVDARSSLGTMSTELTYLKQELGEIKLDLKQERLDNKAELKEHDSRIRALENAVNSITNQQRR